MARATDELKDEIMEILGAAKGGMTLKELLEKTSIPADAAGRISDLFLDSAIQLFRGADGRIRCGLRPLPAEEHRVPPETPNSGGNVVALRTVKPGPLVALRSDGLVEIHRDIDQDTEELITLTIAELFAAHAFVSELRLP